MAYNSLLKQRRKKIHEKIGEAIETLYPDRLEEYYELLAYHYGRAENLEKAFRYLDLSNRKAAKLNAVHDAMAHFEEAMKVLDLLPNTLNNRKARIYLLTNNSFVFQLQNKFIEYLDLLKKYEPVAIGIGDDSLLGRFYARKGHCEWYLALFDHSIPSMKKAIELCEKADNHFDACYAYCANAWNYVYSGDLDGVIENKEGVLRMCEKSFFLRAYVWAFCAASTALSRLGLWDEATKNGEKAVDVARDYSDNSLYAFALSILSISHLRMGQIDRALQLGTLAVQKAPTPYDRSMAQGTLACAMCYTDENEKGMEILAKIVSMYRSFQWKIGVVSYGAVLGQVYLQFGKYDESRELADEILRISEAGGMEYYVGFANRLLGEVDLKLRNEECELHFKKSIAIFEKIKAENDLALAFAGFGLYQKQRENIENARDYLNKALEILERLGTLVVTDKIREELCELPEA